MGKALKRVLIGITVFILVAVLCLCLCVALIKTSPDDSGDGNGTIDTSGDDSSGNTGSGSGNTGSGSGNTGSGSGNTGSGSGNTGSGSGNTGSGSGNTGSGSGNTGSGSGNTGSGSGNTGSGSGNTGSGSGNTGSGSDENKYTGLFAGDSHTYTLTSDYTFTEADVKATSGVSNVTLDYVCTFDLSGHTLDLGGYELKIASSSKDTIKFMNGKIVNGKMNISIPNGDVEFSGTNIEKTVTYDLEAASDTIKFSNAVISGKCNVKSNSRVSVDYSNVSDISFAGNGILAAGNGAIMGSVSVSENATGATLKVSPSALIKKVELNGTANVEVSGNVSNIVVGSAASGSSVVLKEDAVVAAVIVNAGDTNIKSENASVIQVIVADDVAGTVTTSGVDVTTASAGDMENYLGHMHALRIVSKTVATCETDGEIKYECECGETKSKITPAYGHKYNYEIISEPTGTSDGVYLYKCTRCDSEYTATIPKADAIYYHMDVLMTDKHLNDNKVNEYDTVNLKYIHDATGEYYLLTKTVLCPSGDGFTKTVYTVKLLSQNGLPEVKPTSEKHCGSWVKLSIEHSASATVKQSQISGGVIKLTENGYEVVNGGNGSAVSLAAQSTDFNGSCYFNTATGATSEKPVHKLNVTGELLYENTTCEMGITVTTTCENCDYTDVQTHYGHYFPENITEISTQCCESGEYFAKDECVVCHYQSLYRYLNYSAHRFTYDNKTILTAQQYNSTSSSLRNYYIKVDEVSAYGFDTTGFYYGYSSSSHCAQCGLNVYEFTYYTHTQTDGCKIHTAYVFDYRGNQDYESFNYKVHASIEGHYPEQGYESRCDLNTAVNEAKTTIGEELLIVPTSAYRYSITCKGCGLEFSRHINLVDRNSDQFDLTINTYPYDSKEYEYGHMPVWEYRYTVRNLQTVLDIAGSFGHTVENATKSYFDGSGIYYNEYEYSINNYIELYSDTVEMRLAMNNRSMDVTYYYIPQCKQVISYYNMNDDGDWVFDHSKEDKRHSSKFTLFGEHCKEDGKGCYYCSTGNVSYSHNFRTGWKYENIQSQRGLTTDNIDSLSASISVGRTCQDCETLINVDIVLKANWTLTNDVYMKAEDISIDLNGFTINLNGHSLVIYSYSGADIVITDSSFDTSTVPDYDPETYTGYTSKITNSKADGVLVLASKDATPDDDSHANILVGTVYLECDVFASDTDDRYTLYDSLLHAEDKSYDLEFVKAEKPVVPTT